MNKKLILLAAPALLLLTGCQSEEQKQADFEIKDCQSAVLGILDSGFNAVMSDAITLTAEAPQSEKIKLSGEICKLKNPMYFRN